MDGFYFFVSADAGEREKMIDWQIKGKMTFSVMQPSLL